MLFPEFPQDPIARPASTRVYPRTDRDAHRSALKVSDEHKWSCRPHCNDHIIACDRARTLTHPPSLREGVGNERQLRAAGLVIQFAVDYGNNFARCRREDWCAEPDKRLRGLRREHRTPASLCRKPASVDSDEVNRVGRSEQVSAMARNAVRGAVLHNPPTSEGQSQHNRKGIQRSITSSRTKGCGPSARHADSSDPPLLAAPPVTDPRASDANLRGIGANHGQGPRKFGDVRFVVGKLTSLSAASRESAHCS